MAQQFDIAVFEGDGIGPEIIAPTLDLLRQMSDASSAYKLNFIPAPAGAGHFSKTGDALPAASIEIARNADASLLSAIGLPGVRYPDGTEITPQIDIRIELGLYAGVRPVTVRSDRFSPLTLPEGKTIDFVLVRESTEGLFHTQGKGEVGQDEARETLLITRGVSEKLFRFTFNLAERRRAEGRGQGRVTCVDKANVFRAFAFFREMFDAEGARHPGLTADHAYVDAMALWMVQRPWDFDVMVTENMFGDILSDLGAGLMGGLGLAPSADIGDDNAVFQPCHGSAPDIAGQGVANPVAMVLSAAMMLEWLGSERNVPAMIADGARLRVATDAVLDAGHVLTRDLGGTAGTADMVAAITDAL